MDNLIFIGGIHGSGKGTICKNICLETDYVHVTASELLKWEELSSKDNKLVKDIAKTQNRLLNGLIKFVEKDKKYLLDGHFCLLNGESVITPIPEQTFMEIAPRHITIVSEKPNIIKERLEKRDKKPYCLDMLINMQELEIKYSKEIAVKLGVTHSVITNNNFTNLLEYM